MPPKAILFDFDGVIADTDNHHIAAWQRTLAVMGWQIADEVAARSAENRRPRIPGRAFCRARDHRWQDRRLGSPQAGTHRATPQGCSAALSGSRGTGPKASRTSSPGRRLGHMAREYPGGPRRRGPGRIVRYDHRQRRRDGVASRPPTLISLRSNGSGSWPSRRSPSKIRRAAWPSARAAGIRADRRRPSAASSANGSATPRISRDSNRLRTCCSSWDFKVVDTIGITRRSRQPRFSNWEHIATIAINHSQIVQFSSCAEMPAGLRAPPGTFAFTLGQGFISRSRRQVAGRARFLWFRSSQRPPDEVELKPGIMRTADPVAGRRIDHELEVFVGSSSASTSLIVFRSDTLSSIAPCRINSLPCSLPAALTTDETS